MPTAVDLNQIRGLLRISIDDLQLRCMSAEVSAHDWLPGPLSGPIPLSVAEIQQLYASNLVLTQEDVSELSQPLPYLSDVLNPDQFRAFVRKRMVVLPAPGSDSVAADAAAKVLSDSTLTAVAELCGSSSATVVSKLRSAVYDLSPGDYEAAYDRLADLSSKRRTFQQRNALIAKLALAAPNWAAAIVARSAAHSAGNVPGDAVAAWAWRQAQQS